MDTRLPNSIDPWRCAQKGRRFDVRLRRNDLARLGDFWAGEGARLNAQIDCSVDSSGQADVALAVQGKLQLSCQRCLKPLELSVDKTTVLRCVKPSKAIDEKGVEQLDVDEQGCFDPVALIEDETLLAIPLVPKHESCEMPMAEEFLSKDSENAVETVKLGQFFNLGEDNGCTKKS